MDYFDHTKHDGSKYLAHFNDSEPYRQDEYHYATIDWGQRTREIFTKYSEKPQLSLRWSRAGSVTLHRLKFLIERYSDY